jgi:hypothetical protein
MRPTSRPDKPYTIPEIIDKVYQHFILEKNPRCINNFPMSCVYGLTGCAIGCLMTQEDADFIDNHCHTMIISELESKFPDIYNVYFKDVNKDFLLGLQQCHDHHFFELENEIKVLREQYVTAG